MSIQAKINDLKAYVSNAYNAISGKGGTLPSKMTAQYLAYSISSIPVNKVVRNYQLVVTNNSSVSITIQIVSYDANSGFQLKDTVIGKKQTEVVDCIPYGYAYVRGTEMINQTCTITPSISSGIKFITPPSGWNAYGGGCTFSLWIKDNVGLTITNY